MKRSYEPYPVGFDIVETHVNVQSAQSIAKKMFPLCEFIANYNSHYNSHVWAFWLPSLAIELLSHST